MKDWPAWFAAKTASAPFRRNVALGLHPVGWRLLDDPRPIGVVLPGEPPATCGNCAHLRSNGNTRAYYKCALARITSGPGTDIRKRWPACEKWRPV